MDVKHTILVVDDEKSNIDFIVNHLHNSYDIKVASNGEVALKALEEFDIDLVLLDIQMPVLDGYKTLEKMKKNKKLHAIPVVFLSSKNDSDSLVHGFELGAKDYITKPFNLKELEVRVHNHLDSYCMQKKIVEHNKEFEAIFNSSQDGISVIDLEGNFVNVNNAFVTITGFSKGELLTKNCNELTAPEDRERNESVLQRAIENGVVENFEKSCIVNNNKRINVTMSVSLMPNKKTLLLMIKDTTSLKLLEQQSKLASMGEMIGNIAHQWRQPLSIITTSASGLKMEAEYGVEISAKHIAEYADLVVQQAEYLSKTIDNFRNFLKADNEQKKIEVSELLEYTIGLVRATLKNNNITFIESIEPDLYIEVNRNELAEAFINIINNAKDILKEKIQSQEDRYIFLDVYKEQNGDIVFEFKDSGGGIPDTIINRIFEPYFTSKHKSIGTGLGLSMAEKIIRERHGGIIRAFNTEYEYKDKTYKGACFRIVLKEAKE